MKPPAVAFREARTERRASQVVTAGQLGRMYERSSFWARSLLKRWYAEQQAGGEIRVLARRDARGRLVLETTIGALMRSLPPARDEALVRKVEALDRDLDFLARRFDRLLSAFDLAEKRIARLEGRGAARR